MIGINTVAGEFTRLDYPKSLDPEEDIKIKVDGDLVDLSKSAIDFWAGCFTAKRVGIKDASKFTGWGTVIGPEWAPTLHLGIMPSASVSIIVKLWANDSFWAEWDWDRIAELGWEEIVSETITIKGEAVAEEAKFPWKWIALGGGILAAVVGISLVSKVKQ